MSAEQAIIERARALVTQAKSFGWSGPPFDAEMLASLRAIRVDRVSSERVADAMLVPTPDGFVVQINESLSRGRFRFGLLHEVAHTFFSDCAVVARHRRGPAPDEEFEALCDLGASELLFPLAEFSEDLASAGGVSVDALVALRERYEASWEATANRMVRLSSRRTVGMILLEHRHKPRETRDGLFFPGMEPPRRLRVEYSVGSGEWDDGVLWRHKSVPPESVLYELLGSEVVAGSPASTVAAEEDWAALGRGRVSVGAVRLSTPDTPRVLALVLPATP